MRGHIRRRGARSWAVVIDTGRDATGKRRQRWHSVKGTRRDAERELVALLQSLQVGEYVEPSKLTVKAFLERWLKDSAKPTTSGKTYERYAELISTHVIPALGHRPLSKLQTLHVQSFYGEALESGRRDGKGGLSPRTVLHLHRVLHQALSQAVRWQLVVRNAAASADPPRPRGREMKVLTEGEVAQLLKLAKPTELYIPVLLAATTGMRRGEILALAWSDIDVAGGRLTVTKSLEETRTDLVIKPPKTAKGRRTIPLPALAVAALRIHKAEQSEHRLRLGCAFKDAGYVAARADGSCWYPDAFSKAFQKLIRASTLPRIRFHDLRHSHATHLLRQSVHPKVVAERLGHSSITITLDTYSHVVPGLQEAAAQQLDATLARAIAEAEGA